ncbi:hypothetical protein IAR55_001150 [Kwoniella newhampshirensis]|uniref:CCHC-type domain-containing protein n=1 Tax=Kwoniella newhampshirensis TaxID=1651941 RepID=A0AAW0Z4V4_9TREE
MAKRRRASDVAPTTTDAGATSGPSTVPAANDEGDRPSVKFLLADGSGEWKTRLKSKKTLEDIVPKVIDRLGVDASPQQIRLAHVRGEGREVDIWDEFDFSALKSRAFASPSPKAPLLIKVYPPSASSPSKSKAAPNITSVEQPINSPTPLRESVTETTTPNKKERRKKINEDRAKSAQNSPAAGSSAALVSFASSTAGPSNTPAEGSSTTSVNQTLSTPSSPVTPGTQAKKLRKKKKKTESPAHVSQAEISSSAVLSNPIESPISHPPTPEKPTTKPKAPKKKRESTIPATPQTTISSTPPRPLASTSSDTVHNAPSTRLKKSKKKDSTTPKKPELAASPKNLAQNPVTPQSFSGASPAPISANASKQKSKISLSDPTQSALFTTSALSPVPRTSAHTSSSDTSIPVAIPSEPDKPKSRKRKRDSVGTNQAPLSAGPSLPSVPASSPINEDAANSTRTQSESPTKPPKKKRAKQPSEGQRDGTAPVLPSTTPTLSVPPSPAAANLSQPSAPTRGPMSLLNRYKPTNPSPLGRVTHTKANDSHEEDSNHEALAVPSRSKSPEKRRRKREKKAVKPKTNQTDSLFATEPSTLRTADPDGPIVKPGQRAKPNELSPIEAEETTWTTPEAHQLPPVDTNQTQEPETAEDQVTSFKRAKAAKRQNSTALIVESDVPTPSKRSEASAPSPPALEELVPAELPCLPSLAPATRPNGERNEFHTGASKQIPISTPYLLHVRPIDPFPFVSAKFSSSSFERRPASVEDELVDESQDVGSNASSSAHGSEAVIIEEDLTPLGVEKIIEAPISVKTKGKKSVPAPLAIISRESENSTPTGKPVNLVTSGTKTVGQDDAVSDSPEMNGDIRASPSSPTESSSPVTSAPSSATASTTPILRGPNGRVVSATHAKLALRGACIICRGPSHLQKDCPNVKAGVDNLRALLRERNSERRTANTEQAIETLEMWIDRLDRIARTVKGPTTVLNDRIATEAESTPAIPVEMRRSPSPSPQVCRLTTPPLVSTLVAVASPDSVATSVSNRPTSPGPLLDKIVSPPREHSLPPIHLKALATRKAGSISGLSVSDAVIETGSSESDSDDEDESDVSYNSETGSVNREDKESKSGSESRNGLSASGNSVTRSRSTSRSSASSTSTRPPVDISTLDPSMALQHFLTAPLSQRQKKAARLSAAAMNEIDLEEEVSDASEIESSPEPLPPSSLARIRRDSESSVGEFEEPGAPSVDDDENDEDADEVMPFTQPPTVIPSQPLDTIETLSIDGRRSASQPSDGSRRSFADLAAMASPTPVLAEFPGSIALQEAIDEDDRPERDAMVVDSEDSNNDGRRDGELGKTGHVISQGLMSPPLSTEEEQRQMDPMPATQMLGRGDVDATPRPTIRLQASQRTRGSPSPSPAPEDSDAERQRALDPPIEIRLTPAPASPPPPEVSQPLASAPKPQRRRLRSASRDLAVEIPSPRRVTRARSQMSVSPQPTSQPTRRSARLTTPVRSSQFDQLDPSSPVQSFQPAEVDSQSTVKRGSSRRQTTPLASSPIDQLQSSPARSIRMRTPRASSMVREPDTEAEYMKTPLIPDSQPETQKSQSQETARSPRAGLRSRPSPLFMSQGSQIPQTQAYNLFPANVSSSDIGETPASKRTAVGSSPSVDGRGLGKRGSIMRISSPIIEENEETTPVPATPEPPAEQEQESEGEPAAEIESEAEPEAQVEAEVQPDITVNGENSESSSSSDEDDKGLSIPIPIPRRPLSSLQGIYPPLPRSSSLGIPPPASQPLPIGGSSFPTLSSLPREALRKMKSTLSFGGFSSSQPEPNGSSIGKHGGGRASMGGLGSTTKSSSRRIPNGKDEDGDDDGSSSSSGDDSSEEDDDDEPVGLKGRFAGAKKRRTKSLGGVGSGRVMGW